MADIIRNIEKASYKKLLKEYKKCDKLWGKWSCDSFGYYITALHKEIVKRGGWPAR
jgi:hypothetical protein